jgi:hypothetical protein
LASPPQVEESKIVFPRKIGSWTIEFELQIKGIKESSTTLKEVSVVILFRFSITYEKCGISNLWTWRR